MSRGGEKEDIKSELIGGGSLRHLNTLSNLKKNLYQNTLCIVAIVDCSHVHLVVHQNIPCLVAVVTAPSSLLRGLDNITPENATVDILIKDQLRPPLDIATVDQERELHNPNS